MNDRPELDERLRSPDLAERIAARLDVIDENLCESGRLAARIGVLHGQARVAGWWRFLARQGLLREARGLLAANQALLDENDRMMAANAADLAARAGGW